MLAQKRCQMRLHDDTRASCVHRAGLALEDLHVGADAAEGYAGAQPSDRAARDRDLDG